MYPDKSTAQTKQQGAPDLSEMNEVEECGMESCPGVKKQYEAIPVPEEGIFRMEQAIREMKKKTEAEKMTQTGQSHSWKNMQTVGKTQEDRSAVGNREDQHGKEGVSHERTEYTEETEKIILEGCRV